MELVVELDVHNTEIKKEVAANLTVTVYLNTVWYEISRHNRIYVSTYLSVPVIREDKEETIDITLRDYYNVATIVSDEKGAFVSQMGYVEGKIRDVSMIKSSCSIWSYDCN